MLVALMHKALADFSKTAPECRRYPPHFLNADLRVSLSGAAITGRLNLSVEARRLQGWRSAIMTSRNDDPIRDLDPDHPQHLLIAAYTRLMQLPRQADGMRSTSIIAIANWELRLVDLPLPGRAGKRSLWVELIDLTAGRSIDSRGCHDLDEAEAATAYFLALSQRQSTEGV